MFSAQSPEYLSAFERASRISVGASPQVITVETRPPTTACYTPTSSPQQPTCNMSTSSTGTQSANSSPRRTFPAPRRSPDAQPRAANRAPGRSPLRTQHSSSPGGGHNREHGRTSRLGAGSALPPHPPLTSILSTVQELSYEPQERNESVGDEWGGAQEHAEEHGGWADDDETDAHSHVYSEQFASFSAEAHPSPPPPSKEPSGNSGGPPKGRTHPHQANCKPSYA